MAFDTRIAMQNHNSPTTLTEKQLAARWSLQPKALQSWRQQGRGPRYLKLGGAVRYPIAAVLEYEQAAERVPEAA
jgi:hypothetical protein